MIKDINPGTGDGVSTQLKFLTAIEGTGVFFEGNDGVNGRELWITKGDAASTIILGNQNPSSTSSGIYDFYGKSNSKLFFRPVNASSDVEIWASDGTAAGTVQLKNFGDGGYIQNFVAGKDWMYFSGEETATGRELWKSDGTAANTSIVKELKSGTSSGMWSSTPVVLSGNRIVFAGDFENKGIELVETDGSAAGTKLFCDVRKDNADGFPSNFVLWGNTLYFIATDDSVNEGLFKVDVVTATKDIQAASEGFSVFPNPASNYFSIANLLGNDSNFNNVQLFSATGRLIMNWEQISPNQATQLPRLPTGSYHLLFQKEGQLIHKRLTIID